MDGYLIDRYVYVGNIITHPELFNIKVIIKRTPKYETGVVKHSTMKNHWRKFFVKSTPVAWLFAQKVSK